VEKFKEDIYLSETNQSLSKVFSVKRKDEILSKILKIINSDRNTGNLFAEIENKLLFKDLDEEFTFDIERIFLDFKFKRDKELFVFWNKNDIDKIEANDLIEKWEYIWYGSSDDAVILFDEPNERVLMITHYGRIYYN
jgi:hypothetical protein